MRKFVNLTFAALLFCLIGAEHTANAQTDIGQVVFTEIEKRTIKRFYQSIGLRNPENNDRMEQDQRSSQKSGKHKNQKHWKNKSGKKKKFKTGKGKPRQTPPGLTRRNQLPPGLAKRDTLPPGLAKRSLPSNLESQLPPLPVGVERAVVGDDVVLIQKGTNLLLDVLENILDK